MSALRPSLIDRELLWYFSVHCIEKMNGVLPVYDVLEKLTSTFLLHRIHHIFMHYIYKCVCARVCVRVRARVCARACLVKCTHIFFSFFTSFSGLKSTVNVIMPIPLPSISSLSLSHAQTCTTPPYMYMCVCVCIYEVYINLSVNLFTLLVSSDTFPIFCPKIKFKIVPALTSRSKTLPVTDETNIR